MTALQRYHSVVDAVGNTALRGITEYHWMKLTRAVEFGLYVNEPTIQNFENYLHVRRHQAQGETVTVLACTYITNLCPMPRKNNV